MTICQIIADICQYAIYWLIMKKYIEQTEIMALFFRSYFLYTRAAFVKKKDDEAQARINAYKTLMRIFGKFSKDKRTDNILVINEIRRYLSQTETPYNKPFMEVIEESIRFIYDHVLITEQEQRLLERYA
jgi:hypothetical protein